MYEAVRTRAPVSTKMTGVSAMVLGLLAAGYAFANGLGAGVAEALAPPMVVATIEQTDDKPPPEKQQPQELKTRVELDQPPPPNLPDEIFTAEKKSPIRVDADKPPPVDPGAGVGPAPRSPVRGLPRLIAKDKPDYPAKAIRNEEEGITGLDVCVDARGRATSVTLASTSGHEVLDEAAMKWVRGVRFAPGTLDGQAAAMCGARVLYEWKITR